jgi:hypothetical protein
MTSLAALLIASGCGAYQLFRGNFVKAFAMFITSICSAVAAFGFFEQLSAVLIGRDMLVMWAQPMCLILLFIIVFTIFQLACWKLIPKTVDLGIWPERIGRSVLGFLSGLIISGTIITGLAAAPVSNTLPYSRFDEKNPNPERPKKLLVNADGFTVGLFSILSGGSFSGKSSFSALHPAFLDQLHLNKLYIKDNIPILTQTKAIEIPKTALWPVTSELKDSDGGLVTAKSGHQLFIARIGIRKAAIGQAGLFTPLQLRLICKKDTKKPFSDKGVNLYPLGYLKTSTKVQRKMLNEKIMVDAKDFTGQIKYIDFVFELPEDISPTLAEFKLNNIELMPSSITAEKAPPIMPFISTAECETDQAELKPLTGARLYGLQLSAGSYLLSDAKLAVPSKNIWLSAQTENSTAAAEFEKNKIIFARAELAGEKLITKNKKQGLEEILFVLNGYRLLSLKCNNPVVGKAISAQELPVLVEARGFIHCPVGAVVGGELDGQTVYQVDYCAVEKDDKTEGLVIATDGSVEKSFVQKIWLAEKAQSITEFYLLYLIKSGGNIIISSVRPADSQQEADFEKYQGFLIK